MSVDSKLDPLFEKLVADKWLPGVAGAIYDASGKAVYHKAFGVNKLGDPSSKPFTTSTPLALFSTTKLFACVAALQLIEQGKLSLDDLAEKYVPEIAEIPVAEGHDSGGKVQYRPQRTKITILHLPHRRDYIDAHIVKPLGLKHTTADPPEDGQPLAHYGGGHYLTSTLDDYTQFLLAIVNYGTHPTSGIKILERATVEKYLFRDFIPEICPNTKNVGRITSAIPQFTLSGQFLPGLPLGCGFWAGLGNLYYWVDPVAGRVGMVVTSVLSFMDSRVLEVFDTLEKTAYGGEPETDPAKRGFSVAE
ncbi:hypothetical protein DV736_g1118, partial [Chaetothyriales sp. CBS 134916]